MKHLFVLAFTAIVVALGMISTAHAETSQTPTVMNCLCHKEISQDSDIVVMQCICSGEEGDIGCTINKNPKDGKLYIVCAGNPEPTMQQMDGEINTVGSCICDPEGDPNGAGGTTYHCVCQNNQQIVVDAACTITVTSRGSVHIKCTENTGPVDPDNPLSD